MNDLDHFLRLARQGRVNECCSSGERKAYALAKEILKYAPGMDSSALKGAWQFMQKAIWEPNKAEDIIEGRAVQ